MSIWICELMVSTNIKFWDIVFSNIFSAPLSLVPPCLPLCTQWSVWWCCTVVFEALFFFSSLFFNFRLDNFYCSVFKFVDFLANSSMLLNLLSHYDFFKLSYCIFNWRHMILIIFMSTDIHYLMSIALIVFFSSLKIFVIAGLEPSIP